MNEREWCVCVREREIERERDRAKEWDGGRGLGLVPPFSIWLITARKISQQALLLNNIVDYWAPQDSWLLVKVSQSR